MGKTRDLFKKIRDTKGTFHAKMGSIKDTNGMDLTEAEDIKKRWQEYTEELYKKDVHDPDNHDGVITDLEPDILECTLLILTHFFVVALVNMYFLFFYFCLCWGFVAARAFSSCRERGLLSSCGARASRCSGFSCCPAWAIERVGFSSCGGCC